ncbi:GtrA family protein [Guptibacillus hwajinpoensis]|uniref:GtrA family protein n=1 Tax=Guptibacillus hwajinpoensis TaxID=208199 RepID=UPI00188404FB|nr:GtrA family protein [Pseudalkalibacillus hwajinpoensis]MBF0705836.1 GtrA family protein [Pseudalkalibacillus hwajinpoensis]WLR61156.1 GtrA family protein [Pseudalkalibacillus hwajinpoensis]
MLIKSLLTKNKSNKFVKFGITGIINTVVDLIVFFLFSSIGMTYWIAQSISYSSGVVNSYMVNRKWTFQQTGKRNRNEFSRFVAVNLITIVLSTLVIKIGLQQLNLSLFNAKLIATLFGMGINYSLLNTWVFIAPSMKNE